MAAINRRAIQQRAQFRCEYCQLEQVKAPFALFHVEHVVPRKHGGGDSSDNLAWACFHCNAHKGPNLAGLDPVTGQITPVFNPRLQTWEDHFQWSGPFIVGTTAIGRTTVAVLEMNAAERLDLRQRLQ